MARVLIADPYESLRILIAEVAACAGHDVVAEASTGETAMEQFSVHRPDMVIIDGSMKNKDGQLTCERIRSLDSSVRIILCLDDFEAQEAELSQPGCHVVNKSHLVELLNQKL